MEQKFNVGDRVRIVSEPCNCLFSWVKDMDRFCGREVVIGSVEPTSRGFLYRVLDEHGIDIGWNWCENCFEDSAPEFTVEEDEFSGLLAI